MIIYKVINLKNDHIYSDIYFSEKDARDFIASLAYPHIHDVFEETRNRLVTQTVNLEAMRQQYKEPRKNDRMTVYNPKREGDRVMAEVNYFGERVPVVYDFELRLWRIVAPVAA